ncbi:MAG TPA: HDIG domain-containing protein [Solirubrobacteraceae bacterium]|nr:HDIG domain-containing protein [Solirubrobacteraceae bacterium]
MSEAAPGEALRALRAALEHTPAWLVGGVPRDRALGRVTADLDVVVEGSASEAARAVARAAGGAPCFELSADFSGWRVIARDRSWQVDVQPLRGGSLTADLALRDFTVNAIAEPVGGGAPVDPLGGLADLAAGRLRMASPRAFAEDPLRALRLVRIALDLGLEPDRNTARAASLAAGELGRVSGERTFMELRRVLASPRVLDGLELMGSLGLTAAVLPELQALHGVEQSRFHHRDVYGHTLEVLERVIALQGDPAAVLGAPEHGAEVAAVLAQPLADELTRGDALRWGALLHDAAKPLTRAVRPDGRVTFVGHDVRGAELARSALERLRTSERLRAHVAALVRHHLRLGFLVHEPKPLARRTVFAYMRATSPVEVDVTLLSVADRLATRGDRAAESIDAHLRLAGAMLADALRWRAEGPPKPLWRGDELAAELSIPTGPRIGQLLEELAAAQYAGEVATRDEALAHARALLTAPAPPRSSS